MPKPEVGAVAAPALAAELQELIAQWRSEGFDSAQYANQLAALLARVAPPTE